MLLLLLLNPTQYTFTLVKCPLRPSRLIILVGHSPLERDHLHLHLLFLVLHPPVVPLQFFLSLLWPYLVCLLLVYELLQQSSTCAADPPSCSSS
jgi:hypothetical protein